MSTPFNVKMQKPFFFKYSQAYEGGSGWRDRTNPGCFGWGWMHGVLWVDKHNLFFISRMVFVGLVVSFECIKGQRTLC